MDLPVYDIVLLPNEPVYQQCATISKQLEDLGTEFTLEEGRRDPHMSLYMANLTPSHVQKAMVLLDHIAHTFAPIHLTATQYGYDAVQGMFEIGYARPSGLVRLQQSTIAAINPLRTGLRKLDPVGHVMADWLPQTSGEARQNLEQYGYDEIGGLFRPHITLTRFRQRNLQPDLATLPDPHTFDTTFATLGLYEMGLHGTCTRVIHTVQLENH